MSYCSSLTRLCMDFVCMCNCLGTGNMQLPYNNPGGYLVHILFFQFVFFPINGPGQTSGKPWYSENYKYMFNTIQWDKCECKFDKYTGNSCLLYRR